MIDLQGKQFGRLTVLERTVSPNNKARWVCRCTCGSKMVASGDLLRNGTVKSCGCLRREMGVERGKASRKHGEGANGKETAEYRTWASMLSRCNNPNHRNYPHYGARGIKVCERWHSYENFLADMGRRPANFAPGRGGAYSIDRINNDGNYEPGNCRWATSAEQNNNKNGRGYRWITVDEETKTLAEWLEVTGLPSKTFYRRICAGMTPEEAILLSLVKHQQPDP